MTQVVSPEWKVSFSGGDLARNLKGAYLSVIYTDYLTSKSDDVEVVLDNKDGIWTGPNYPKKGDLLRVDIGFDGGDLMPAGGFYLDEFEASGPPDVFKVRGMAANILPDMRTKRTKAYEEATLQSVAGEIAGRHGLSLKTYDLPNSRFKRITQSDESDLAFLRRLCSEQEVALKVTSGELSLIRLGTIEQEPPVITLDRTQLKPYRLKDRTRQIYTAATIKYLDNMTGLLTEYTANSAFEQGDTLHLVERAESEAHAREKAEAALRATNQLLTNGRITTSGNPMLQAGNSIMLTGLGQLSGKYLISMSVHTIRRNGPYTTGMEVRRV